MTLTAISDGLLSKLISGGINVPEVEKFVEAIV